MTLKVMSGDKIDIMGKSYYAAANTGGLNYNIPVLDIITGLLGATGGTAASKGFTSTDLNGQSGITSPIAVSWVMQVAVPVPYRKHISTGYCLMKTLNM